MRALAFAMLAMLPARAQDGDPSKPIFVAVGYGGRRASSPDGIRWEGDQELSPEGGDDQNLICDVAFGWLLKSSPPQENQVPSGATLEIQRQQQVEILEQQMLFNRAILGRAAMCRPLQCFEMELYSQETY